MEIHLFPLQASRYTDSTSALIRGRQHAAQVEANMTSRTAGSAAENRRIDSWKEIASFFGRDERTVKRWEKERGLPVHRLPGERGGVFAWSQELTAWLNSAVAIGKAIGELDPLPPIVETPESQPTESPAIPVAPAVSPPRLRRTWIWVSIIVVALAAAPFYSFHFLRRPFFGRSFITPRTTPAHHTPDPEAQEFYLKGRYYWSRRTEGSLRQAIDAFTQAVVHDSNYAQAYAGLAECYDIMPEFTSMRGSEAFPRAIAAASKAIALDPSLAEAHRALGFALFYWEWKVPAALSEYQRAIQLDPRDEEGHHWYATSLLTLGRFPEAMEEIDKAQQLNPASRSILSDQSLIRFWAGDRAPAIQKLREIEQAEPEFFSAPRYLAGIAFAMKDYRTYIDQTKRLAAISNDEQMAAIATAAQRGLSKGGERGLLEAIRVVQQRYFDSGQSSGFELARTCALLGRQQEAVIDLKAAIAAHDYMVLNISTDQAFGLLNGDPAFEEVLRQITARMYRA
jgi:tetratricopeptide (TPR) repeat protein